MVETEEAVTSLQCTNTVTSSVRQKKSSSTQETSTPPQHNDQTNPLLNLEEEGKLDRFRNNQNNFLKTIFSTTSHDPLQLDYSVEANKTPTLRQMIMSLKTHLYFTVFTWTDRFRVNPNPNLLTFPTEDSDSPMMSMKDSVIWFGMLIRI